MTATMVKICGVRSPEIARVASEAGADLMGLIFAPSRRQVTLDQAEEILDGLENRPKIVGVFVNESAECVNAIATRLSLDFVQLNGDESPQFQEEIDRPVIRALRLPFESSLADARREAERYLECRSPARALLLDTHLPGVYGGTGMQGNWDIAAGLADEYPVILAGGLRPESVAEALRRVRPLGVDVSSGVETDGVKDANKIRQFIDAVRHAEMSHIGNAIVINESRTGR
jgi:phosphoribosylanthranilate isomerase